MALKTNNDDIITFANRHNLTPEELVMYLVLQRSNAVESTVYYHNYLSVPGHQEIFKSLAKKGLVYCKNPNKPLFEDTVISSGALIEDEDELMSMAEELWMRYPATFPLSTGSLFIARKGAAKEEVLKLYLEKIKNSREKHKQVLVQLDRYVKLVNSQKINGHRIIEWIANEMWDAIPEESDSGISYDFKRDI